VILGSFLGTMKKRETRPDAAAAPSSAH
jgi:hypothetical protein